MDSRERVMLALSFQEPDRVPIDFWGSGGFFRHLKAERDISREEFLEEAGVDFRYIEGPRYIGLPLGEGRDLWGVPRKTVAVTVGRAEESYKEVTVSPLSEAKDLEQIFDYPLWPSADWFDYSVIKKQCEQVHDGGKVVVFMGDRLNRIAQLKPAMYMRGMEQIFVDMMIEPELARAVFKKISDFYQEYLKRILESADGGIDIVCTGDDFGSQNTLLVSPEHWIAFLGEGFAAYNRLIGSSGARSMHHTCGYVTPIIPHFVERGLDILQSLQPESMAGDFSAIKRQYARTLCFQGGISIQNTIPRGTPEDVRREVRRNLDALGGGGGYIISTAHNVQADCPLTNVDALIRAYHDLGRYPMARGM